MWTSTRVLPQTHLKLFQLQTQTPFATDAHAFNQRVLDCRRQRYAPQRHLMVLKQLNQRLLLLTRKVPANDATDDARGVSVMTDTAIPKRQRSHYVCQQRKEYGQGI